MDFTEVYINKTGSFYPNQPISNEDMESYLGLINEQASKSRRIVLRNNGIENRYYAIDEHGNSTHNNAEMVALAIRNMLSNPEDYKKVDLLACGTTSPDQLLPSHAAMVHGKLPELGNIEVVSPSGACCSGIHSLKYAYLSIKCGQVENAICTGSELQSRNMRARNFELEVKKLKELEENPFISFEKDFLRWMLSDGAGSFYLSKNKNESGVSLRIDWMEGFSFANELEACMYMGAEKTASGDLSSFMDYSPEELMDKSILALKQDTKLLAENIVSKGFTKLVETLKKKQVAAEDIDFFLPHMSSYFFQPKIYDALVEYGYEIPYDRWFTNLKTHGNVGAGSIYLMVDQLLKQKDLKPGQHLLLAVPESARFSYMFAYLTVV